MSQQQSPWIEGAYGWNFGESGWNSGMDTNLLKFSFMFDRNVDGVVASLPAAVNGQAYFLTTDNRLYFAVGTTWLSSPTPKWFQFTVKSTGVLYQYNGTSAVIIDSPSELDSRLDAIELTITSLGTAAFQSEEFFATQAELDISESNSQAYADSLATPLQQFDADIQNKVDAAKGAHLVGFLQSGAGAVGRSARDKLREVVSVTDFGAVGDGTTDDTAAIQAAIDAVDTAPDGGVIYFPPVPVSYRTTSALVVPSPRISFIGAGRRSRVLNQTSNLLQIGNAATDYFDVNLRNMHLQATAGHVITLGAGSFWSVSSVTDCYLLCGTATNVIRYVGTSGGMFDINFNGGEMAAPPSSTENIIYVEGNVNVFSANQFNKVRFQTNGSPTKPCVELICNGAGQYFFNNKFAGCNFEIPNAGAIKVHGGDGTEVSSCGAFDITTTTRNLWEFGATAPGIPCRNTVLTAVNRFGGALGGGLFDIYLQSAQHTTMIGCEGTAASAVNHNINNQAVVVLSNAAATLTNLNAANSARVDNLTSILQSLTTNGTITVNGTIDHNGTQVGFYGATPVNQPAALADTSGATLATIETHLNTIKQKLRNLGLMAP